MRQICLFSCLFVVCTTCSTAAAQNRSQLIDPEWIQQQVTEHGVDLVIARFPQNRGTAQDLVYQALDLSRHILRRHPELTRRQLHYRLHAYQDDPDLSAFQELPTDEGVQLRSLWPSFDQAGGPLVRMIDPIGSRCNQISVNPDGTRVVFESGDGFAEIYDVMSGFYVASVIDEVEGNGFSNWSFTPDCRLGLNVASTGRIALWNIEDDELITEIQGKESQFHSAISGDGRRAITCPGHGLEVPVRIWNVETGDQEGEMTMSLGYASTLELSEDGSIAVTTSGDGIEVWDVNARQRQHVFTVSELEVDEWDRPLVTMTADGRQATTVWSDAFRVYDLETGMVTAEWPYDRETKSSGRGVDQSISSTTDGRFIATSGLGGQSVIQLWDTMTQQLLSTVTGKFLGNSIAVADDGHTVVTNSGLLFNARLNIWDMRREDLDLQHFPAGEVDAMSADGRFFALDSVDGAIAVYSCQSGEQQWRIELDNKLTHNLIFSRDSQLLFSQVSTTRIRGETPDSLINGWNAETGELLHSLTPPEGIRLTAASADGHLICKNDDDEYELWDYSINERVGQLDSPVDPNSQQKSASTPDESRLVVIDENGKVTVWDLSNSEVVREFMLDKPTGNWLYAWDVSDSTLVVEDQDSDGDLQVWDLQSGKRIQTLSGHRYRVGSAVSSNDGRYVVSLNRSDCEFRIWDVDSGECLYVDRLDEDGRILFDERCERIIVDPIGPRVHLFAVEDFPGRDEVVQ